MWLHCLPWGAYGVLVHGPPQLEAISHLRRVENHPGLPDKADIQEALDVVGEHLGILLTMAQDGVSEPCLAQALGGDDIFLQPSSAQQACHVRILAEGTNT